MILSVSLWKNLTNGVIIVMFLKYHEKKKRSLLT